MSRQNPWVGDEWVEASAQLVIRAGNRELVWDLNVFDPTDPETYTVNGVEEAMYRAVNVALDSGFLGAGDELLLRLGSRERRFRIASRPDGRYRLEEQHRRLRSGTTERKRRAYLPNPLPRCQKCGEPARVVIIRKARVRCALSDDGTIGDVISASRTPGESVGYECGGGHTWSSSGHDDPEAVVTQQRAALRTWLFRLHRALLMPKAARWQRNEVLGAIRFARFVGIITDVERTRLVDWVITGQWERSTAEIEFLDPSA